MTDDPPIGIVKTSVEGERLERRPRQSAELPACLDGFSAELERGSAALDPHEQARVHDASGPVMFMPSNVSSA